jgi:aspartate 1-decarboxylase
MLIEMFQAKIHRATITQSDLEYEGSICISGDLLDASGIREFQKISVWNIDNGSRLETYVLRATDNSGIISINGAGARLNAVGNKVILCTFCSFFPDEADKFKPTVVLVDEHNKITSIVNKSGGMI